MSTDGPVWYYAKGERQFGPLRLQNLIDLAGARKLSSEDLVWHAGMNNWLPACRTPELSVVHWPDAPPPLPETRSDAKRSTRARGFKDSAQPEKKRILKRIFLLTAAAVAVASAFLPLFHIVYATHHPFVRELPHAVWGYDISWDAFVVLAGVVGMLAAIVDIVMPLEVRSITRWIHWPVYTLILVLLLGGTLYTYESGLGFDPIIVLGFIWLPSFVLLVFAFAVYGLIASVRICTRETLQHPS